MGTWMSSATVDGRPEEVLELLTDPSAAERWSPVSFEVEGVARLSTGSRARVGGSIVGRRVEFDVEILEAGERRLVLRAQGPIEIEARYDAHPLGRDTRLDASVSVHSRGGLLGRLMAGAADGLLAAGALESTVTRIASEMAQRPAVVPLPCGEVAPQPPLATAAA